MVRDYKKKPSYVTVNRYRSPKIFSGANRREKKSFKLPSINWRLLFGLVFAGAAIYYFYFSPQFRIKDIIVEGNNIIPKADIANFLPQGENIFRFNIDQAKQQLLVKFPEIKQIEIYRGIPDALKVVVLEREGKLVWQTGADKYLISVDGDVSKKIDGAEGDKLPVVADLKNLPVTVGSQLVSPNFVAFITNLNADCFQIVGIKPISFEVPETTFDINMKTDAGFYVKLNSLRSSQKQLDNLKLVLAEKKADIHEYLDLRIDGWAYYK